MQNFREFFHKNRWAILLAIGVIAAALLFYVFGWWTLLLGGVVALAIFFGHLMDRGGTGAVKAFFRKLFSKEE